MEKEGGTLSAEWGGKCKEDDQGRKSPHNGMLSPPRGPNGENWGFHLGRCLGGKVEGRERPEGTSYRR